jgi:hypothetical protein
MAKRYTRQDRLLSCRSRVKYGTLHVNENLRSEKHLRCASNALYSFFMLLAIEYGHEKTTPKTLPAPQF